MKYYEIYMKYMVMYRRKFKDFLVFLLHNKKIVIAEIIVQPEHKTAADPRGQVFGMCVPSWSNLFIFMHFAE